ncbi:4-oxalocrotonate tautomerase [Thermodesulfobium acidiphilum]|uniref:4-oxalocrotonate tautomerase n=1 Tax=Thermodesulfobium acidiphilum TaxID=1794699 RepID=A0A2R4W198_THEAF|nr:2-hydroxymuconate tautomerase [Thermodesulfobium acidiphilum]AWB10597.1 4-oxalocrotonate tautomerase [Thermodesulfobium acidiphilum]PMP85423.1 MAG: 4-oxalocrotonate tautomerase [Thermodesulfobium narugense]
MPIITIELLEGRSEVQKKQIAKEITETLVKNANVKPEAVTILFHDLKPENIAKGGKFLSEK